MKTAIKNQLKKEYLKEYSKQPYNCHFSQSPRYGGGTINLLIAGSKKNIVSIEIYTK